MTFLIILSIAPPARADNRAAAEMAEKIGRSVDMASGLERGVTATGSGTLTRIADIRGCALEGLFTFDPEAKPRKRNEIDDIIALLEGKPPALRKAALAQLKVLLSYAEHSRSKTTPNTES